MDPKEDIPQIEVSFTNGLKQMMVLRHYNAIPNSDLMDHSRLCNYLGHLEGDKTHSTLAVTGCLNGDEDDEKMHITLFSKHSPHHRSFSLDKNGVVKHIETRSDEELIENLDERTTSLMNLTGLSNFDGSSDWTAHGGDTFINQQWEAAAAEVTEEQMRTVPSVLKIKYRLGYDQATRDYLEARGQNVDNWLAEVMTHSQAWYMHSSLQHKLVLEVKSVNIGLIIRHLN